MLLCGNHWKFWMISILKLWNKFSERYKLFKKMEYRFLVESTKIDNITFPYKTALSEANVKTMGSTKLTHHKEQSFASNHFPFSKILFQFRNLVYRVDLMYQQPKCPYSYFPKVLEFYFRVFFPCEYPKNRFECGRNKECSRQCIHQKLIWMKVNI